MPSDDVDYMAAKVTGTFIKHAEYNYSPALGLPIILDAIVI